MTNEFKTVFEYYLNPEREILFGAEVRRAMTAFAGAPPPMPIPALPYFADWFLFDFPFAGGEPPVLRFPKANPLNLSAEALAPFNELAEYNRFDFFSVSALTKERMTCASVRDGSRYSVARGGMQTAEGEVVVCRIGRARGIWEVLNLDPIAMQRTSARDRERMKTGFPIFNAQVAYREIVAAGSVEGAGASSDTLPPHVAHISDSNSVVLTASAGKNAPQEEFDNCAVCRLLKRCKEEGHNPSEAELKRAMDKDHTVGDFLEAAAKEKRKQKDAITYSLKKSKGKKQM